jgi:hypothetical protein
VRGIATPLYSRTADVEKAVVADFWTASSRIAAAARATTMTTKHAATKLRIVVLRDVSSGTVTMEVTNYTFASTI